MDFTLNAGAATVDVTPLEPCFLFGYPHVPRTSVGTHDPLLASAVVIEQNGGGGAALFIAVDVIFVTKALTDRVRRRVARASGVQPGEIMLTATHTHSGPVTVNYLSNENDAVVPRADVAYMQHLEDGIVEAAVRAWRTRRPAEVGFARADATGVGTCRHDPAGPSDLSVPVLSVRDAFTHQHIAVMLVCAMHPTVLHENSRLFSGDFPAFARQYIQRHVTGLGCPVVYHTGASGDQSPRHVTRENTMAEARRLGEILGSAVERALVGVRYDRQLDLVAEQRFLDLPPRDVPAADLAVVQLEAAAERLATLRNRGAERTAVRSAECDWFGAEETLAVARAAADGRLDEALAASLPAEVQILKIGDHAFVGWPGEFFVEFSLRVRERFPDASVITMANGELQGYVVTQRAVDANWYEAGNALLKSPDAGDLIVDATVEMLAAMRDGAEHV